MFESSYAKIIGNSNLYPAQIDAYQAVVSHYQEFKDNPKYRETLVVMPTGSGKSGVMALLPYGLSSKRVLIITPGKTVRSEVYKHFNTAENPEKTFWIKHNVIYDYAKLPKSYKYEGFNAEKEGIKDVILSLLEQADLVITNVHKIVGSSEEINLKNILPKDFFDLIIVDEAHHVAADMWQESLNHFNTAKVIKLTATPFRSDNLSIITHELDPIYEYTLGQAIEDGLLKEVVKEEAIPNHVTFTKNDGKELTLEEARLLLGSDAVSTSIAMSEESSKDVINFTKKAYITKQRNSKQNHQILAVACNDQHAQNLCQWFNDAGLSATYVSTRSLSPIQNDQRIAAFTKGDYKVMVSIQLLGEGYDNPNISIISIFRPYRTLGPYAQAIGRGLRKIYNGNDFDNICNVIYHRELQLDKLWEYYKNQRESAAALKKQLTNLYEQLTLPFDELGFVEKRSFGSKPSEKEFTENDFKELTISVVQHSATTTGNIDSYSTKGIETYLREKAKIEQEIEETFNLKIAQYRKLKEAGTISEEDYAILVQKQREEVQQVIVNNNDTFHDQILAMSLRSDFTTWINQQVEATFEKTTIDKEGYELCNTHVGPQIVDNINNISYIVKNIRVSLSNEFKKPIDLYTLKDYADAKIFVGSKLNSLIQRFSKEG
ncbi:DEAD/DEAH box helicase family protein [Solibacillus sp. FSL W8-0372]|uniref:DEAD/DEAH box helicase n=1 Tax=Solibacillus sp. FSL W8-0372 TaxID=2921713 RepID=UPI0030D115F2